MPGIISHSPGEGKNTNCPQGQVKKGDFPVMKKNVMMRVASALLVAVLLSTCVISGTFAKYVTSDTGSDYARVAQWGVVVVAKNYDMFTDKYETKLADDKVFVGDYSVDSNDDADVLAPGTEGSFADIRITGTPEVAVDVKIEATVAVSDTWKDGSDAYYCPIVVTVGTTAIDGLAYSSAAEFAAAIEAAIEGKSAKYAPNTNLASVYDTTNLDLAWSWAFTTGDVNDVRDTALGNRAMTEDLTISIGVAISVTQID